MLTQSLPFHRRLLALWVNSGVIRCRGEAEEGTTGAENGEREKDRRVYRDLGAGDRAGLDGRASEPAPAQIMVAGHTDEAPRADVAGRYREPTCAEQRCASILGNRARRL